MPTEEHTPRVYLGHARVWTRCNCGWRSEECPNSADASFQWADHVEDLLQRQRDAETE